MAKVWLPHWQCTSGDLPACCIVCGCEEEIEYLDREMEYRPSWPATLLGFHFLGWHLIGGALAWFSERYNQVLFSKFPYCGDHYDYWQKRDRRQHLGILIIALGWMLPFLAAIIDNHNARLSAKGIMIGIVATVIGLIIAYSYGFKIIHVAGMKKARILLADVHPDFAAAVEQQQGHGKR
jgi:hypothetical protein